MVRAILPEPMNLRTPAARDGSILLAVAWLALGVTGLWATAAAGRVVAPWMLFPILPAAVALVAAVRRVPVDADRAPWTPVVLAFLALSLIGCLAALFGSAMGAGRPLLEPSPSVGYVAVAAAVVTVFHAVLVRRRAGRVALRSGTMLALGMLVAGVASVAVAEAVSVPTCATAGARVATVRVLAESFVDGVPRATATVATRQAAAGEAWTGELAVSGEEATPLGGILAADETLAGRVRDLLGDVADPASEDLGVEELDGEPARHCRAMIGGPQAMAAFPPFRWLVGDGSTGDPGAAMANTPPAEESLPAWRGELDWWVGAAGELRRVEARVGGHPGDAWSVRGLRGLLRVTMLVGRGADAAGVRQTLP